MTDKEVLDTNAKVIQNEQSGSDNAALETNTADPVQTLTPQPAAVATKTPEAIESSDLEDTKSREQILEEIMAYATDEWGDDENMIEYEYDKQVESYDYCCGLQDSSIKEYALNTWTEHGVTDWCMVEYEYDRQMASYEYMQSVGNGDAAISKWTSNGYTDWCMAEYEYTH